MSGELIKARSQIGKVRTFLKQEKYLPAVQALYDALLVVLKNPLMKNEKEEFSHLLSDATYLLDSNKGFHQLIPLKIHYEQGQERELLDTLKECLSELQNSAVSDAKEQLKDLERKRTDGLEHGRGLVKRKEYDEARNHFNGMMQEFSEDATLKADIGDIYLDAQMYEDAYGYLSQALEDSPESLHLYNRIGMALRKMGLYETAEKYYHKALAIIADDSNLYFNMGRLYIDWQRWDKVVEVAEKALELNPSFSEAQKMRNFAKKRL